MDSVTIVYGPNSQEVAPGRSVAEFRSIFSPAFGIPPSAKASLRGTDVYDENIVPDGGKLVFALETGSKG